jgi:osmotically-inducible protein OsmY
MRQFTLLLFSAMALITVACRTNESPERQVDDAQITAAIKSKLAADVGLSTVTNISVNSTNGVVTLAGQVDSEAVKVKAEAAAKSVPKVVRVINNLQVAASAGQKIIPRSRAAVS